MSFLEVGDELGSEHISQRHAFSRLSVVNSNEGREGRGTTAAAQVSSDGERSYGAFNPGALEAEAEESLSVRLAWSTVPGQPGLHREIMSREKE